MRELSIAIADDHRLYTEALSYRLEAQTALKLNVLFTAGSGHELLVAMNHQQPDILLLDLNMPEMDGLTVLPQIKAGYPAVKIIIVTMYDTAKFIKEAFNLKCDGYFLKSNPFDELLQALELVMDGQVYLSEGLKVFPKQPGKSEPEHYRDNFQLKHRLTPREIEILQMISDGKNNREIAADLYISDQTVGVHRKNIMKKLRISNSAGLIKFAMQQNLS